MTFRAAVIGAGMIGAKMDRPGGLSPSAPPQTHAGGYLVHPGFTLTGICDPHPPEDIGAWGCPVYTSVDAMLGAGVPDIVSVAVTPDRQPDILRGLANAPLKAVIAEKPLAQNLGEAREVTELFERRGIPLLVNYSRRFVPFYSELRRQGETAPVLSATVKYGKGLLHNGSHAVDILRFLFGECLEATPLAARFDHTREDPTLAVFMAFERSPMTFLQPLDNNAFLHFEIDVVTAKGRWMVNNDHRDCHVYEVLDNVGVPPGKRLLEQRVIPTGHENAILNLLDNAEAVLKGEAAPLCVARDAVRAQEIIEDVQARAGASGLV